MYSCTKVVNNGLVEKVTVGYAFIHLRLVSNSRCVSTHIANSQDVTASNTVSTANLQSDSVCNFYGSPSTSDFADVPKPVPMHKPRSKYHISQHFVDYKQVTANGGNGGDGMFSFLRLFNNPFAGPSGGNGGNGGHVIFIADPMTSSLAHLHDVYNAAPGSRGRTKCCHGASAQHLYINVPIGTMFKNAQTGRVVAELLQPEKIFIAARGGAGGHGNRFYLSNENRAPVFAEYGAQGESIMYDVEMKIIAQAGLVGFPNAGKSTLLRAVSRARPKVAAYPFTTLNPTVGTVNYDDHIQLTIADIPGLIPGAHTDEGLGLSFLRHIERCVCLFYVIDLSLPEPLTQLRELEFELEQYKPGLSKKPHAIVANKIDLDSDKQQLQRFRQSVSLPVFAVSAKYRLGIQSLLIHFRQIYDQVAAIR